MTETLERLRQKQKTFEETQEESLGAVADPSLSVTERLRERQRLREQGVHATDPLIVDKRRREAFLAAQTGRGALAEPGLQELGLRADIGLSDTFEEKKAKFMDKYPQGDFIMVFEPRTDPAERPQTILFRRHQNEDYAELDARALDRFELLMDVGDISGELPAAAMEALLIRGGSVVKQMGRAALGTLTGDALKEAVEETRGYQRETLSELATREAMRVPLSAFGAGATVAVTGPLNSLRGASSLALKPSARAAQRAAARMDMPPFLPGQLARSPFLQKMQGQASAVFKTVGDYVSAQQGALARAVGRLREGDVKKVLGDELESVFVDGRNQLLRAAQTTPQRSLTETGTAIQQGIAEWDDLASMLTRWSYRRAEQIEAPAFDVTALRSVANELKTGVLGMTPDGRQIRLSDIDPNLEGVVDNILALDPSLPSVVANGIETTAIDQLRALRSQLWDLKTPNPGEIARQSHKEAGKLYSALTRTLRNPTNANREFVEAWRKADAMAKARFDAMEKIMVIEAGKSEAPAILASRLMQPNQVDNLRILKNTMPDSKWREFQEGVRANFISSDNIDGLTKRLQTFDQATLDALLPRADQEALRLVGQRIDELNSIGIKQSLALDAGFAEMVERLVINNDTKSISRIVAAAQKRPKLRRSLRAGIMESVWNSAVSTREGVRVVNKQAVTNAIQQLRKSGAINLLDFSDIRILKEFELIAELIPEAVDTGTSLVAASAVSATTRFSQEGFVSALKNLTIGRVLTSKALQRALLGKGKEPLPFNTIRNLGSFLGRELQAIPVGPQETLRALENEQQ